MDINEIQVGQEYKVKAPNSSGVYTVLEIKESAKGKFEVVCRSPKEAFPRVFKLDQLLQAEVAKSKSQAKKVVSSGSELEWTNGNIEIHIEEVTYWPNYGKRGRPRKVA